MRKEVNLTALQGSPISDLSKLHHKKLVRRVTRGEILVDELMTERHTIEIGKPARVVSHSGSVTIESTAEALNNNGDVGQRVQLQSYQSNRTFWGVVKRGWSHMGKIVGKTSYEWSFRCITRLWVMNLWFLCLSILSSCLSFLSFAHAESLYSADHYAPLAADHRALNVGDNVTVIIIETSTASASTESNVNKALNAWQNL